MDFCINTTYDVRLKHEGGKRILPQVDDVSTIWGTEEDENYNNITLSDDNLEGEAVLISSLDPKSEGGKGRAYLDRCKVTYEESLE